MPEFGRCQKCNVGPRCMSAGFSCQSCHSRKTSIPGRAGTTFEAHEFVTILGRTWLERVGVFYSSQCGTFALTLLAQCEKIPRVTGFINPYKKVLCTVKRGTRPWFSQGAWFSVRAHPSQLAGGKFLGIIGIRRVMSLGPHCIL